MNQRLLHRKRETTFSPLLKTRNQGTDPVGLCGFGTTSKGGIGQAGPLWPSLGRH